MKVKTVSKQRRQQVLSQVKSYPRLPDHKTKALVAKGTLLITLSWFPQEDPEELQLNNMQGHFDTVPSSLLPEHAKRAGSMWLREGRSKSRVF